MSELPVNAILPGIHPSGYWAGTPCLNIHLMTPDNAVPPDDTDDDDWPMQEKNEISFSRLLSKGADASPHYSNVGANTLTAIALNRRERHVVIIGRETGCHDLELFIHLLRLGGRQVQLQTTGRGKIAPPDDAWVTLCARPMLDWSVIDTLTAKRANEIVGQVRGRPDLDRFDLAFGNTAAPVWLSPARSAEPAVFYQCVSLAAKHVGWRAFR